MSDMGDNQGSSGSSGEIRMPYLTIPLKVDATDFEVYLDTLSRSSMVKGVTENIGLQLGSSPSENNASDGAAPPSAGTGNLETVATQIRLDLSDILKELQTISGKLDVITVNMNG